MEKINDIMIYKILNFVYHNIHNPTMFRQDIYNLKYRVNGEIL